MDLLKLFVVISGGCMNNEVLQVIDQIEGDALQRNAYSSINGYLYQFDLTLYHILIDGLAVEPIDGLRDSQNAEFMVEKIEDYIKVFEKDGICCIRLGQIKYHSTTAGPAKYEEAMLWLYFGFLQFKRLMQGREINTSTDFRAILYHYDLSPNDKDVGSAILSAMNKNQAQQDVNKQWPVYRQIVDFGDSEELRREFCTKAQFFKTVSSEDLLLALKNALHLRYTGIDVNYDDEFLYAAAICKLIEDGRHRQTITLSRLDEYFRQNLAQVSPEFYKDKIIELFLYNLDWYYGQIEHEHENDQDILSEYNEVCLALRNFIVVAFGSPTYRRAFLNTIISEHFADYQSNSLSEYSLFLQSRNLIRNFIAKLGKMIFVYKKENAHWDMKIDEWFRIDESQWSFRHPNEERINRGVIIGDLSNDGSHSLALGSLIRRFGQFNERPYVWYFDKYDDQMGCQEKSYNIVPNRLEARPTPVKPEDYFVIECLDCLAKKRYIDDSNVCHIFKHRCRLEEGV